RIFNNVQLPNYTPISGRMLISARTGGLNEAHWFDDINLRSDNQSFTTLGAATVSTPSSPTVAEGGTVNLSVQVDGTPCVSIQWYSNGVAIAGANSKTYSFIAGNDANGAVYTVGVSNQVGGTLT